MPPLLLSYLLPSPPPPPLCCPHPLFLRSQALSGDSTVNPSLGRLVLQCLCPALHSLLTDGLRPHQSDLISGRRPNSAWGLVQASTRPGSQRRPTETHLTFTRVRICPAGLRLFIIICFKPCVCVCVFYLCTRTTVTDNCWSFDLKCFPFSSQVLKPRRCSTSKFGWWSCHSSVRANTASTHSSSVS